LHRAAPFGSCILNAAAEREVKTFARVIAEALAAAGFFP
jgi:hypothetical protein